MTYRAVRDVNTVRETSSDHERQHVERDQVNEEHVASP